MIKEKCNYEDAPEGVKPFTSIIFGLGSCAIVDAVIPYTITKKEIGEVNTKEIKKLSDALFIRSLEMPFPELIGDFIPLKDKRSGPFESDVILRFFSLKSLKAFERVMLSIKRRMIIREIDERLPKKGLRRILFVFFVELYQKVYGEKALYYSTYC